MDKTSRRKVSSLKSLHKLMQEPQSTKFSSFKSKFLESPSKPLKVKINPLQSSRTVAKSKLSSLEPLTQESIRIMKKSMPRSKRNMSVEGMYEDMENESKRIKRHASVFDNLAVEKTWDNSELPYTAGEVLQNFKRYLTPFEQNEIMSFRNIYYIAPGVVKLDINYKLANNGLDDDRNDLVLVKHDHIVYRYEILEIIGRGSYGQVIKAYDHKDKKYVAIKIIRNLACIIQQARIEIQVLYKLVQQNDLSEHVVHIVDNYIFRNHIIETFDILETNLYQHLKSKGFQPLPLNIIKLYAQHVLQGMVFYERLNIIHCDLKPENIMLNSDFTKAIIIDFGSACFTNKRVFTYIQSRYYRAPEVILEIGYDFKIDMWSFGCVLGELATGRPIFAGKNEIDQFLAVVEVLGLPPSIMLESSPKCEAIVEQFKKISSSGNSLKNRVPGSRPLKSLIPNNDAIFLEFLSSKFYLECLSWNPGERLSPSEALAHDWFKVTSLARQGSLPDLKWEKLMTASIKLPVSKSHKKSLDGALSTRNMKSRIVVNKKTND